MEFLMTQDWPLEEHSWSTITKSLDTSALTISQSEETSTNTSDFFKYIHIYLGIPVYSKSRIGLPLRMAKGRRLHEDKAWFKRVEKLLVKRARKEMIIWSQSILIFG